MAIIPPDEQIVRLGKLGTVVRREDGSVAAKNTYGIRPIHTVTMIWNRNRSADQNRELKSTLAQLGDGIVNINLEIDQRDDIPDITLAKSVLIAQRDGNRLTVRNQYLGGRRFQQGDYLQVGIYALHIMGAVGNELEIENLPEGFDDLPGDTPCTTTHYQIRAWRDDFGYTYTQRGKFEYEPPSLTYIEVP